METELPVRSNTTPHCDVEIDRPESKWQYDQVRWMLLHEGISVYVDHDNDWYLEVQTRCGELTEKNLCRSYLERPKLCEEYSPEQCQVWNPEPPSKMEFKTADEFTAWLDSRGIDWRYKSFEKREAPGKLRLARKRRR